MRTTESSSLAPNARSTGPGSQLRTSEGRGTPQLGPALLAGVLVWGLFALSTAPAEGQYGATNGEWRSYGGDLGSTKYSPLDQIDATNFAQLRIAWRWPSVDGSLDLDALRERIPRLSIRGLQATPLMIDGVLYLWVANY